MLSKNSTEIAVYETSAGVVEIWSHLDAGASRFVSDANKYASVPNVFRAGPAAASATVAALPAAAAALKGYRSYVVDSNAALTAGIGAVVANGGANIVPVFCDGTNWRIG